MRKIIVSSIFLMMAMGCSPSTPQSNPQPQVDAMQLQASLILGDSDNGLANSKTVDTSSGPVTINLQLQSSGSLSVQQISVNSPITLSGSSSCIRNYSGDNCSFQAVVPQSTSGNFIVHVNSSAGLSFFSIQAKNPMTLSGGVSSTSTSLDFGTLIGSQTVIRQVYVMNSNPQPVSGVSASLGGTDFTILSNTCATIPSLSNCIIRLAFSSATKLPTSFNDQLTISGPTFTSIIIPMQAAVQALSVGSQVATLSASISLLDFGTIQYGHASSFKVINVTNQGPAVVPSVQLVSPSSANFSVVGGSCGAVQIQVHQSCSIIVIANTLTPGSFNQSLSINPSASITASPVVVAIQGNIIGGPSCPVGQHMQASSCVADVMACPITNGVGSQSWNGTAYSACVAVSCNSGFTLSSGMCQNNAPLVAVTITKSGTGDGDIFNGSTNVCAQGQTSCTFNIPENQATVLTQSPNSTSFFSQWNPNPDANGTPLCSATIVTNTYVGYQNYQIPPTCSLNPSSLTGISLAVVFGATVTPTISGLQFQYETGSSILARWTTDVPSTSQLFYEDYYNHAGGYSSTPLDTNLVTSHVATITGLLPFEVVKFYAESIIGSYTGDTPTNTFRTLRGTYEVYVKLTGAGDGTISESPTYPECSSNRFCVYSSIRTSAVPMVVTIVPNTGSSFGSWLTGPCAGSTNPECDYTTSGNGVSGYEEWDAQLNTP